MGKGFQPYGRKVNHPVLMKVHPSSDAGTLYLVLTQRPGTLAERCGWESQMLGVGWRTARGTSQEVSIPEVSVSGTGPVLWVSL